MITYLIAAVILASVGGLVGGAAVVIGGIELISGRILINLRQLPWSRRDAQVIGVCRMVQGMAVALEGATIAVIVGSDLSIGPQFAMPIVILLNVVLGIALVIPGAIQVRMSRRTGTPLL